MHKKRVILLFCFFFFFCTSLFLLFLSQEKKQDYDYALQWEQYLEEKQETSLNISPSLAYFPYKQQKNYRLTFSLTLAEGSHDQPFSVHYNALVDQENNTIANGYRITYTNHTNRRKSHENGPRWIIAKRQPTYVYPHDELSLLPASHIAEELTPGKVYDFEIKSYQIPSETNQLHYFSVKINDLVILSYVDSIDPLVEGALGISSYDASVQISPMVVEPLVFPKSPKKGYIIAFGDSIVFGPEDKRDQLSIPQQLQQLLGNTYSVSNYGLPGERLTDRLTYYLDEGVIRFNTLLTLERPEIILIQEGTNNILEHMPVEEIVQNLESMITRAKEYEVVPIVATLTPLYIYDRQAVAELKSLNNEIRALAERLGVIVVDLEKGYTENYLNKNLLDRIVIKFGQLFSDGIHPTSEEYVNIAHMYAEALALLENSEK